METMVLLVFLAIVWAAVGVYWLKTRVPTPSLAFVGAGRRRPSFDFGGRQSATVLPMSGTRSLHAPQGVANFGHPGHSLTQPARRAHGGATPAGGVTSEQARLRRRNVLLGLLGFAAATLLGAFTLGGSLVIVHLIADALLLGFILLLVQYQREIELDRTRNLPVYAEPRQPQHRYLARTGTD